MTVRAPVKPALLEWALDRADLEPTQLDKRFPKLAQWLAGDGRPTLKQLESFARATHAPVGYFFLPSPPEEEVPLPDFRAVQSRPLGRPSPNLLDTVYTCQRRQDWYRDFARANGEPPVAFVGSCTTATDPVMAARSLASAIGFDVAARARCPNWEAALREFIAGCDSAGVIAMVSGIVGSNTHRKLDPEEFRGFALADSLAPIVFVNGADTKAAQMFTLAHELAHLLLGQSGISDPGAEVTTSALRSSTVDKAKNAPNQEPPASVEAWCNQVAAELLVPLEALHSATPHAMDAPDPAGLGLELQRLAKEFKVSSLVILRRLHDAGYLSKEELRKAYGTELSRILARPRPTSPGGDFYRTGALRVGKRFARALVASTLEGQTLYRDAFQLLGISKTSTLQTFGAELGVTQ